MSIAVTKHIQLQVIEIHQALKLKRLMHDIYLPVYKHLWQDAGAWYVKTIFGKDQLTLELNEPNAPYFFVHYKNALIGILRFKHITNKEGTQTFRTTKLHRLYLDPKFHKLGIGKELLKFTIKQAKKAISGQLFLEVMDSQTQALNFYLKNGFKVTHNFRLSYKLMHSHFRGMHTMDLLIN